MPQSPSVIIHPWDAAVEESEWRAFLGSHAFGDLVAAGRNRDIAVVAPTQFVLVGDEVFVHQVRHNPIFDAIEENPTVLLCVAGDWAYVPSSWKSINDEDPRLGVPTTYYAAVQLTGTAVIVTDPAGVAEVLRIQLAALQPDVPIVDPAEHGAKLAAIRGLRIQVRDVRAKFKYGGNVDADHRAAVAARLARRGDPGDAAAEAHLRRRLAAP
jgi:transcriptional regulator